MKINRWLLFFKKQTNYFLMNDISNFISTQISLLSIFQDFIYIIFYYLHYIFKSILRVEKTFKKIIQVLFKSNKLNVAAVAVMIIKSGAN